MSFYGPLTETYGENVVWTPDGSGGGTITTDEFGAIVVGAALLQNVETQQLVARLMGAVDVPTNWANLQQHLQGDG